MKTMEVEVSPEMKALRTRRYCSELKNRRSDEKNYPMEAENSSKIKACQRKRRYCRQIMNRFNGSENYTILSSHTGDRVNKHTRKERKHRELKIKSGSEENIAKLSRSTKGKHALISDNFHNISSAKTVYPLRFEELKCPSELPSELNSCRRTRSYSRKLKNKSDDEDNVKSRHASEKLAVNSDPIKDYILSVDSIQFLKFETQLANSPKVNLTRLEDLNKFPPPSPSKQSHCQQLSLALPTSTAEEVTAQRQSQFIIGNLCAGYSFLFKVFRYLTLQDLVQASQVCRLWHTLANHELLWQTVRMRNVSVVDWQGFADILRKHGTKHLDLHKMLVQEKCETMWDNFCCVVDTIPSLRRLDFWNCPSVVLERVADKCPQLQSLTSRSIRCSDLRLHMLGSLTNLQELRLNGKRCIHVIDSLDRLQYFACLKHLSLINFKELGLKGMNVIGSLLFLESLELGECSDFPESFSQCLRQLTRLRRLRLEKGSMVSILTALSELPYFVQLELINFDIRSGFDLALAQCTNIHQLLIIPMYKTQLARTNQMVLCGVTKLGASLEHFVWGVTHEVLTVTQQFVMMCKRANRSQTMDSSRENRVPVLRPVPGLENQEVAPFPGTRLVHVLPLTTLQKILETSLPKTKIDCKRNFVRADCNCQDGATHSCTVCLHQQQRNSSQTTTLQQ